MNVLFSTMAVAPFHSPGGMLVDMHMLTGYRGRCRMVWVQMPLVETEIAGHVLKEEYRRP